MPLFSKNVDMVRLQHLSSWRKVALGTWRTVGDPSVYGILELPADKVLGYIEKIKSTTETRVTLTHFVGAAVAQVIHRHPEINRIIRWGTLYQRKNIDVFFQVANDTSGSDLSGTLVRNADRKSITDIAQEMSHSIHSIRKQGDPQWKKMKKMIGGFPSWASGFLVNLSSFILYTLNIWSPLLGSPKDPFGSVMVTNIGSLGLDYAFAPLVPYSRVPILIAVGAIHQKPMVVDGKIEIVSVLPLCATFDHRLIDGVHASHMVKTLKKIFENPEEELR